MSEREKKMSHCWQGAQADLTDTQINVMGQFQPPNRRMTPGTDSKKVFAFVKVALDYFQANYN